MGLEFRKMICARALDFGINSVVRALSMTKIIQQDIYKMRGEPRMKPWEAYGLGNLQKNYQRDIKK